MSRIDARATAHRYQILREAMARIRAAPSIEEAQRIADQALSLPPPPGITRQPARKETP